MSKAGVRCIVADVKKQGALVRRCRMDGCRSGNPIELFQLFR